METPILFEELAAEGGKKIGMATLDRPRFLNGLTLQMCESLLGRLRQWEADPAIAVIVLRGSGEKAFCAGGDLHSLMAALETTPHGSIWNNTYVRRFFEVEYRLDYAIHRCAKPVLVWGMGIVMGGGVGLMMGGSHRVVGETTRFAMPEVAIGIFPDVGGSWMLGRLPPGLGLFLGLTGAQLGAGDCRYLGLADYVIDSSRWSDVRQCLLATPWEAARNRNDAMLHRLLCAMEPGSGSPTGPVQTHADRIADLCRGPDFEAICQRLLACARSGDGWLQHAAARFAAGAPGAARICYTLLERARTLSLAEVFRLEYTVMLRCMAEPDFEEGVRALLVDKDNTPRWQPASWNEADETWVERFFAQSWPLDWPHPLRDLGNQS